MFIPFGFVLCIALVNHAVVSALCSDPRFQLLMDVGQFTKVAASSSPQGQELRAVIVDREGRIVQQ